MGFDDDRIKKALEKHDKRDEVFNFISENKIDFPRPDRWVHFANKIGFNEECKKYRSQEELYKSDFWDKCRPLVLSSSDETVEKNIRISLI